MAYKRGKSSAKRSGSYRKSGGSRSVRGTAQYGRRNSSGPTVVRIELAPGMTQAQLPLGLTQKRTPPRGRVF